MMLNIEPRHLKIVQQILAPHNYDFYVFGSRITAKYHRFSDLDLVYFADIPISVISQLEEEFSESDLPYKVDLVAYQQCDKAFQQIIDAGHIAFPVATKLNSY